METKFAVDLRYLLDQQPPDQREMIEKLVANPGFGEESYSYIYEQCSILDVSVALNMVVQVPQVYLLISQNSMKLIMLKSLGI